MQKITLLQETKPSNIITSVLQMKENWFNHTAKSWKGSTLFTKLSCEDKEENLVLVTFTHFSLVSRNLEVISQVPLAWFL